jgi:hypothetical protein
MNKLPIYFLIFLVSIVGATAMISYCGDLTCQDYADLNESNPSDPYFCPSDCGIRVTSEWCDSTYPRDCPLCGTCESCSIARIPDSTLNNWCGSNGYSASGSSCIFPNAEKFAVINFTDNKCRDGVIFVALFLIIVALIFGIIFGTVIPNLGKKKGRRR